MRQLETQVSYGVFNITHLTSSHFISTDLISSAVSALSLVKAATANWVASQRTIQLAVAANDHITLSSDEIRLSEMKSIEVRWGEWYWTLLQSVASRLKLWTRVCEWHRLWLRSCNTQTNCQLSYSPVKTVVYVGLLAGMEYVSIWKNRALCDNFLKLCMVLGMDMTVSKTTAHKLGETPGGRYAQNPRWLPLETEKTISRLILALQLCVIPVSLCFLVWGICFWSHF